MSASSITVSSLTATPSLRGNKLAAVVSATGPAANIPTLMLDTVEFYASTANDFSTASKVVEGKPEALHVGLIEEQAYYYWAIPRAVNGSKGAVYPTSPTGGQSCTAIGMSGLAYGLANGKLVASVASNNLTIAIKTIAGNDPSASDPVFIAFQHATLTEGRYQIREITAALSFTINSGNTLGATNATALRLWVILFDDAGTLRLAASNRCDGTTVYVLTDHGISSALSETEVGAGNMDFVNGIYAGHIVSTKPYRLLGYLEWPSGLTTAGTWDAAPSIVRLLGVNMPTPGTVIQGSVIEETGAGGIGSTTVPFDNTIPTASEGNALGSSIPITCASNANLIETEITANLAYSVAARMILTVCNSTDALKACWAYVPGADDTVSMLLRHSLRGSTSTITFNWRAGGDAAGTAYVNATSAGQKLGGVLTTRKTVREIMG